MKSAPAVAMNRLLAAFGLSLLLAGCAGAVTPAQQPPSSAVPDHVSDLGSDGVPNGSDPDTVAFSRRMAGRHHRPSRRQRRQ